MEVFNEAADTTDDLGKKVYKMRTLVKNLTDKTEL